MNVKVRPIDQLLQVKHLMHSSSKAIVFISKRPNYYNFGLTPFFMIRIPDVDDYSDMPTLIVDKLLYWLDNNAKSVETIYVCCDAGISRSPAVAKFILEYFNKDSLWINNHFYHYNKELYKRLKELAE